MTTEESKNVGSNDALSTEGIVVRNIRGIADTAIENGFSSLLDHINADAAAIWLKTRDAGAEALTIAYNVGGQGEEIEGKVIQPLDKGLVSKAYREGKTICHQGFFNHKEQSMDVDFKLGQITAHQIASPFEVLGTRLGAVTAIQTLDGNPSRGSDWGFSETTITHFENWVEIMQRLFELNIRRAAES